jgi:hypothetical protein
MCCVVILGGADGEGGGIEEVEALEFVETLGCV